MKKILKLLTLFLFFMTCTLQMWGTSKSVVFVLPIDKEIDMSMFRHVRLGLKEARESGADLLLVKLNTYGGALDAADSIRMALKRCGIPTVAFVDPNAASAGALIALACDSVYMSPNGSMGSATVVNGNGEPMPEKYQQYMRAIMRATAESHGKREGKWIRNPEIADRMVRPDESVSFTSVQAVEAGYAEGIASNIDGVISDLGLKDARIVEYEPSLSDDILGFLSNAAVRAILVALILGAIYMEMHTPGLGFAAAVGVVAAVLFFLPMIVVGTVSPWVLLCFILGVILLALEIFVIPGFGICGVLGGLAIMVSLCGALLESSSINEIDSEGLTGALLTILSGICVVVLLALWLTGKHAPKRFRKHTELMAELRNSDGFIAVDLELKKYIGLIGVVKTDMRPAGKIEIEGEILPAVSMGEFITHGSNVKVVRFEKSQLIVEKVEKD